ncbi:hypothetical protein [Hydrogenimonas cancrithermarum]|uniref:Uncharacterized protein n=1 Tax=Hydrogenimonas cancrithermarum TaxID=2993563 RepID=A0ABM8FPJ5_9BACT|nr:hypothetical protein [Hydrogenimonas cancrithermarum]BDY13698.1 hypothetical protein HCR_20100 [Hydrogenimonas cancrithermarum]
MNEIIRKNPRLKIMLRQVKPLITNYIDMAQYDYERYGLSSSTVLVQAPLKMLLTLERYTRKTDMVMALDQNLFFVIYQNTPIDKGKIAFRKILRLFAKEIHEGEVRAAIMELGETETTPEEIIERLIIALHEAGTDEKTVLVDASKILY